MPEDNLSHQLTLAGHLQYPKNGQASGVKVIAPLWFRDLNLELIAIFIEEPLNKDKAFRRYASGVDRSLTLFETALQEWADYISFLGRLLKV